MSATILGGTVRAAKHPPRWKELMPYSACDIADALLKLNVPGAGFLVDISPIPHTTTLSRATFNKTIAPASTFLMVPKASGSFPAPAPIAQDTPDSNVNGSAPYSDYTEKDTTVIISQPAGQSCAVVGGIMALRMKHLGAQSIIIDGRVRDLVSLSELELPVWSKGTSIIGAGAESKFHARNVPVKIGNVTVEPGDIIMADPYENGVVAIPRGKLYDVLELLPKLVGADERVVKDVEEGYQSSCPPGSSLKWMTISTDQPLGKTSSFQFLPNTHLQAPNPSLTHPTTVADAQLPTMGITDFFSAAWDTFSHPSPDAEAPPSGGSSTEGTPASGTDEESKEEADVNKADEQEEGEGEQGHKPSGGDDGDEEESGDGEEEEEEEEETKDPKETLEKECETSKQCAPAKHHYDECVERVTSQIDNDGKAKEDCVEEFFHLAHCASQCAAPKLFSQLK
ncbi:ribonuclease E inhibitor RraA/Dimethylmenaquinone methyltransferase [Lophiotrema nucula]|uniref:Cytochrome b-c1 complex subunit 6, mitochondrial n=1 Tax=Lophiotrema nucula TaxID=690887 RepID=A0A6A5Z9W0_9PLEO|nr:ribonuclease E inhibitor RraA/Dimethylmenaquinone methyltransferase [Lophiotrema nucula]